MYFLIENDPDRRYDDVYEVLDECVTTEYYMSDTDSFDEYLDDGNSIDICGHVFNPSEVLIEMNSDAYNSELQYWAESRVEEDRDEYQYELERARNGDSIWVCGNNVYCYEENEEDEEGSDEDTDEDEYLMLERLEKKLLEQKVVEDLQKEQDRITGNDFLSILGVQII